MMSLRRNFVSFVLISFVAKGFSSLAPNPFDNSILYKINWPGKSGYDLLDPNAELESMVVRTHDDEKFYCILPTIKESDENVNEEYDGPSALELLAPLFQTPACSSRLESYWTYEICHGKYVKQYHEDREGKKVNLQEYFLGRWDQFMTANLTVMEIEKMKGSTPPAKKLDGMTLPYLQLNFTDGTVCDINGKPRRTNVLYVCYTHGKNEIYSIKEISTCVYEVIILTPFLCKHPKYRPQETGEHEISCLPLPAEGRRKPQSLQQFEADSLRQRHFKTFGDVKIDKVFSVYSIEEYKDKDGRKQVRVELLPLNDGMGEGEESGEDTEEIPIPRDGAGIPQDLGNEPITTAPVIKREPAPVPLPIKDFLSGKDCLRGGSGWWQFKFCYGDSVKQFHIEKDQEGNIQKTEISLGVFKKEAHLEWLRRYPHKRPKPQGSRRQISHFYSDGSFCDQVGRPRETEVKLKCNSAQGSVSVYLLEPQICRYELGVESPLVCEILDKIDENGLVEDYENIEW